MNAKYKCENGHIFDEPIPLGAGYYGCPVCSSGFTAISKAPRKNEEEVQKMFHITIKENGRTLLDCDSDCIIGTVHDVTNHAHDSKVHCIGLTAANAVVIASGVSGAVDVCEEIRHNTPIVRAIEAIASGGDGGQDEDNE